MIIGVLKEPVPETRVSLLAEAVSALTKKGWEVWVEPGAGINAFCTDEAYKQAGASLKAVAEILSGANIILSIHQPTQPSASGAVLIGMYQAMLNKEKMEALTASGVTVFSMELLPRTTRAQSMDILSSQANIAGYKAVLLAANTYGRYFPMFMTAAGSIAPAKVLILGAGVAGLQAIATARRLGAIVEEVMSLGAKFVEVEGAADPSSAGGYAVDQTEEYKQKQQQRIAESVAKSDIIITTAQIPGKKAPILITSAMLDSMRVGSVIIDLAAATGGNTPETKNNETVVHKGVTIIGNSNLPATMPSDASKLYGKNIMNFIQLIVDKEGKLNINMDDDLVKGSLAGR
jgi:H+-translocating NAD(P) transhydrogenase subunit alpha